MSGNRKNESDITPPGLFMVIEESDPLEQHPSEPKSSAAFGAVIETDDETPITPATEAPESLETTIEDSPKRRAGVGIWAIGSVAALVIMYLTVSIGEWVYDQFHRDHVLGYVILAFIVPACVFLISWLWHEIYAWKRLAIVDEIRVDLSDSGQSQADRDRFLTAVQRLQVSMERPQRVAVHSFIVGAHDSLDDTNKLRDTFDRDVMHPMDDVALSIIRKAVYDSFFLGLLSPTPITDTAVFIVRAVGMIRGVAGAYGHRPGKLGLLGLMKRILADLTILFSVMIIMSHASSMLGGVVRQGTRIGSAVLTAHGIPGGAVVAGVGDLMADASDVVAKEVAEAITAAARMAKLGLLALAVSRPLALSGTRKVEVASRLRAMMFTLRRLGQQRRAEGATTAAS